MRKEVMMTIVACILGIASGCGENKVSSAPSQKPEQKKSAEPATTAAPSTPAPPSVPVQPAPAEKKESTPAQPAATGAQKKPSLTQPQQAQKPAQPKPADGKPASTVGVGDVIDYGMGKTPLEIKKNKGGQAQKSHEDHNKKMNDAMKE